MRRSSTLWILAFVLTLASAYYQRTTGPTYPLAGKIALGEERLPYRFDRSHGGSDASPVRIAAAPGMRGTLAWKRYKTSDPWTDVEMRRDGNELLAELPGQPPAGKLEYFLRLQSGDSIVVVPADAPVVIRFKGEVPLPLLIVHIIAMFGGMLLSLRCALESLRPAPSYAVRIKWTLAFLFVGGLILGPFVQRFAFGAYWTGWPFGTDLTDNKTLVAFLGWVAAAFAIRRSTHAARWVWGAAVVTFLVYMIPHSVLGSELNYKEIDARKSPTPVTGAQKAGSALDSVGGKQ
jgi:hypothetical protein